MGLIIVTLMVLIVYGMIQKAKNPDFSFFSSDKTIEQQSGKADAIQDVLLDLPRGSTIEGTDMTGEHMAIRVDTDGKNGADTIIVIDISSGKILSRLGLNP
ncbi:MAG: hypothetical protein OEW37_00325 [Rhodospirillaceae bacterium]|nr:hypothetical protein [Rhodospirillaceae bacterium]